MDPSCSSETCLKSASACPSDNPVASFFKGSELSSLRLQWTDGMPWSCVHSLSDYPKGTTEERIAAAASAIQKNSSKGGVVYLEAGTYKVSGDIVLPPSIILRGAATTAPARSGSNPGSLAPATRLEFPELMYNGISCSNGSSEALLDSRRRAREAWPDSPPRNIAEARARGLSVLDGSAQAAASPVMGVCSNSSVVNLDIDSGYVSLASDGRSQWMLAHGNRIRNVNYKYPEGPSAGKQPNEWPWRFSTALAVVASDGAAVTNNLLGQATLDFKVDVSFTAKHGCSAFKGSVPFATDNRYGLHLYGEGNKTIGDATIAGNYVYQNGRVGIFFGGRDSGKAGSNPGQGVLVQNNMVSVAPNTTLYSVTGASCAAGFDTNENRGYDQTGTGNSVISNQGHINRQHTLDGYETTDGEGVLQQPQDGNDAARNVWTSNDFRGGSSGYMAYYGLLQVEYCELTDNYAAAGEDIGILKPLPGLVLKGNKCKGNHPPAQGMKCN